MKKGSLRESYAVLPSPPHRPFFQQHRHDLGVAVLARQEERCRSVLEKLIRQLHQYSPIRLMVHRIMDGSTRLLVQVVASVISILSE